MNNTKFNVGDLVAPIVNYGEIVGKKYSFIPFAPNENSICTVKSIDMNDVLYVDEVRVEPSNFAFNAKCWRLVEPAQNLMKIEEIDELIEESTMVLI